jgi:predicted Zn-dependent peptidase
MFEHITYKESKLASGLTVLTAQNSSIPVVDAQVWTRTGYRYEKAHELGYAHLLEHMLFGGTKRRPTARDLSLEVERRGGYFNATTTQQSVVYEMQMMSQDAQHMCDILSDMILESTLSPDRLNIERKIVLQELKQKQESHRDYLARISQKRVFPGHPLSQNILDTEQTTLDATPESLRTYLKHHYRPDQSALVLSGDISHERAIELAEQYFKNWVNPEHPFDPCLAPMTRALENYYFEKRDIAQTFLVLAYYTTPFEDLRVSAAWRILQGYLSVGSTSALVEEVREKLGLVYSIGSSSASTDDTGSYTISTSTQKPREAIDAIERVVSRVADEFTPEAFEHVKGQAIGSFVRMIVKPDSQADALGDDFIAFNRIVPPQEWLGHLESVTREEAIALAQTYLRPDNSVLIMVGPEDIGR